MTTSWKTLVATAVALGVVAIGVVLFIRPPAAWLSQPHNMATTTPPSTHLGTDAKNTTYTIDGSPVTLVDGVSVVAAAPGSAATITTRYFGNEVVHDLNGDGRPDTAGILTQSTGGSGTFYYAVAALNTPSGYVGSQGVLLGDRIAPQATTIDEGTTTMGTNRQNVVVFNYAERKPGESFATPPSIGKSLWLKLDPATMQFGEVMQQ